jgi:hypothetical protein
MVYRKIKNKFIAAILYVTEVQANLLRYIDLETMYSLTTY